MKWLGRSELKRHDAECGHDSPLMSFYGLAAVLACPQCERPKGFEVTYNAVYQVAGVAKAHAVAGWTDGMRPEFVMPDGGAAPSAGMTGTCWTWTSNGA